MPRPLDAPVTTFDLRIHAYSLLPEFLVLERAYDAEWLRLMLMSVQFACYLGANE